MKSFFKFLFISFLFTSSFAYADNYILSLQLKSKINNEEIITPLLESKITDGLTVKYSNLNYIEFNNHIKMNHKYGIELSVSNYFSKDVNDFFLLESTLLVKNLQFTENNGNDKKISVIPFTIDNTFKNFTNTKINEDFILFTKKELINNEFKEFTILGKITNK